MNFDFSDDQKMLRDQARSVPGRKMPAQGRARGARRRRQGHDAVLWKQLAEMGWLGTAIPEAYGGLGLGYLELCVVAEELGRALAPVPFSSTDLSVRRSVARGRQRGAEAEIAAAGSPKAH